MNLLLQSSYFFSMVHGPVAIVQLPAALPKPLKNKKAAVLLQQPFLV
jgi:hypothetical protein